jgi:hypothetical protein
MDQRDFRLTLKIVGFVDVLLDVTAPSECIHQFELDAVRETVGYWKARLERRWPTDDTPPSDSAGAAPSRQ